MIHLDGTVQKNEKNLNPKNKSLCHLIDMIRPSIFTLDRSEAGGFVCLRFSESKESRAAVSPP